MNSVVRHNTQPPIGLHNVLHHYIKGHRRVVEICETVKIIAQCGCYTAIAYKWLGLDHLHRTASQCSLSVCLATTAHREDGERRLGWRWTTREALTTANKINRRHRQVKRNRLTVVDNSISIKYAPGMTESDLTVKLHLCSTTVLSLNLQHQRDPSLDKFHYTTCGHSF